MAGGFRSFLAFWLGGGAAKLVVPSVITDVRSGQLLMRSGRCQLHESEGSLALFSDAGRLSLFDSEGSLQLLIKAPEMNLVITS